MNNSLMSNISSIGFEAELFLIDSKGQISTKSDEIINKYRQKFPNKRELVKQESSKEIIEINALPSHTINGTILNYISEINNIDEIAQKKDLYLLPMAIYPGQYKVNERNDDKYYSFVKQVINFNRTVSSFHFHYPIPNKKQKIVDMYNLLLAAIPVFNLIMQSSPFYMGEYVAKDTRKIILDSRRINENLEKKLASNLCEIEKNMLKNKIMFTKEQGYVSSFDELLFNMRKRKKIMYQIRDCLAPGLEKGMDKTDFFWGPVRLNKIGTIEFRSPDNNLYSLLLDGLYLFQKICEFSKEVEIKVCDENHKPLDFEDKSLCLPEFYELEKLIYKSAKYGFDNHDVVVYARKFIHMVCDINKISAVKQMFEKQESISDYILMQARKKGWMPGGKLTSEQAQEISLDMAQRFIDKMDLVYEKANDLFSTTLMVTPLKDPFIRKIVENLGIDENKIIDLSRASPIRFSQIKTILISPDVPNQKITEDSLLRLSNRFNIIILRTEKEENKKFKELVGNKVKLFTLPEQYDKSTITGLFKILLTQEQKKRTAIVYYKPDIKYKNFGVYICFLDSEKREKQAADILVEDIGEIDKFLTNT